MHFYRVLFTSLIGLTVFGCATHKDFGSSFIVLGEVECQGNCDPESVATVRLLDTGLDYKRRHHRFVIASESVKFRQPFLFETTYLWGYKQITGAAPVKNIVTVEVITHKCTTNTQEINLKEIKRENGKYLLELGKLNIQCEL